MDRDAGLLDCYRAANVKVFASRTETQGLVLLEAMALGVPVVSTAIMGTKDVLRTGCGAEVVAEDEALFAAAVARVLDDSDLAGRLGDAVLWLAGGHALAGLYHHYFRRDNVLVSMLPFPLPQPGRRGD